MNQIEKIAVISYAEVNEIASLTRAKVLNFIIIKYKWKTLSVKLFVLIIKINILNQN